MGALFQDLTPDIKVTVAEYSERHSMSPTYIHKLNLGVNMSYNMRHALNTMFACCRWVVLSVNCFCLHTTVMLTVCYINTVNLVLVRTVKNNYFSLCTN